MPVLAGNAHSSAQVAKTHHDHVHPRKRHDRIGVFDRRHVLELQHHQGGVVHSGHGLVDREGPIPKMRQAAGDRTLSDRREFRRSDHRPGLFNRRDVRGDHAQRPAVENPGNPLGTAGGHTDKGCNPDADRRQQGAYG